MRSFLDELAQHVRYALRQLRNSPAFALVATLSLAVGIGANVTMFSVANAFLSRPVAAERPDELIRVYRGEHSGLPRDWYLHFARNSQTMAAMVAEDPMAVGLSTGGSPERAAAIVVSENFFTALGLDAAAGTLFAGTPGTAIEPVVVLSHAFWRARLGSDASVVGRVVRINDLPFTVVGVGPAGFRSSQFGWAADVFIPLSHQAALRGVSPDALGGSSLYITARLAAGRTAPQAQAELLALASTLPGAEPEWSQPGAFTVAPARGITAEVRTPATIASALLMAVVGLVLLIACANLANLLLARATGRRREIAIRTALGVSRGRLVRQMLTESTVIALIGGAAGFAVAAYVTRALPALLPAAPELAFDLSPDARVVAFAIVLALATGLVFGLAPALHAAKSDVQGMLRSDGAGGGSRRSRLRSAFLAAQVSLATMLLVTAGLFIQGLSAAQGIDPGFRSDRVVNLQIDLGLRTYDADRGRAYFDDVLQRVRALDAVESASLIRFAPLTGANSGISVGPASAAPEDRAAFRGTTFTTVAPGYLELAAIPMVAGRTFTDDDREGAPRVAVVNESFARMLWPDRSALGQPFRFQGDDELTTVIGVTRDTKYVSLNDDGRPFAYLPLAQSWSSNMTLQARLRRDSPAERAALAEAVRAVDPALPLGTVTSMDADMGIASLPARLGALFIGSFGALALVLAMIGVYGVTAFLVGQRTAEVGIRTALGATPRGVLRLMMGETVRIVAIGLVLGLLGSVAVGQLVSSLLYGVGSLDPAAFAGATALLVTAALVGTWLPARRALRVDTMRALRGE